MIRTLLALIACVGSGMAQIQLSQWNGTTETVVGSVYQLSPVAPGDAPTVEFHVRNLGTAAVTFQTLAIAGANFKITASQSLPYIIAPGFFSSFVVTFSPDAVGSYSANLQVNSQSFILRGSAVAVATLSSGGGPLAAGSTIDFGKIEKGTAVSKSFALANTTSAPLTVSSITLSGAGFQSPIGISTPVTLAAGQSLSFQIAFAPQTGGPFTATLRIDQRSFQLIGTGLEPPLPSAAINLAAPNASSAQQQKIAIKLGGPSKVGGTGTLTMEFRSAVPTVTDDPAIQFLSGPQRAATVTINSGESIARFGTAADLSFQTGTTAGTIVFTLTLPNSTSQATLIVNPSTPGIDLSTGVLRVNDLDISLTGFDNTRTLSQLAFTFYDRTGKILAPGQIKTDVTKDFANLYKSSPAGGAFALRATFPIIGDATKIGGVDVEVTNDTGATKLPRISF